MAAILILNKLEFGALMSKNLKIIKSTKLHMDAFKKTDSLPLKYSPSPQSSHMSQRETGCMLLHRKLVWDQNCALGIGTGSSLHTAMAPRTLHSGDHSQAVQQCLLVG